MKHIWNIFFSEDIGLIGNQYNCYSFITHKLAELSIWASLKKFSTAYPNEAINKRYRSPRRVPAAAVQFIFIKANKAS